ncbi:uncharacterized protein LOC122647506 [Telopea speciosissima]|uniref:uncharacterized protein LOC122647506 n=1 Tax=Telopea speciosissima TaxID=54955 RepID=UPI001CC37F56|nr:uncharacterized protein LOC122647506 [Telopea speciosissima]
MHHCLNNGENGANRIWVFAKDHVNVDVLESHSQFLTLSCAFSGSSNSMFFATVHASCSIIGRNFLWKSLGLLAANVSSPWALCGDFNVVLSPTEKIDGRPPCVASVEDFNEFVIRAALFDAGFEGNSFTWSNGQVGENLVRARLDRVLCNLPWNSSVHHLTKSYFDHAPIWIPVDNFILEIKESSCLALWLKDWNREVFGNIHQNVKTAEDNVAKAEEGERHTRFFHVVVNMKRKKGGIGKIKNAQGEWLLDREGVNGEAIKHFSDIFSSDPTFPDADLLDAIPSIITSEDNDMLTVSLSPRHSRRLKMRFSPFQRKVRRIPMDSPANFLQLAGTLLERMFGQQ